MTYTIFEVSGGKKLHRKLKLKASELHQYDILLIEISNIVMNSFDYHRNSKFGKIISV